MRDIKRIDRILEKIGKLWKQFPDQRLGQLMENYIFPSGELRGAATAWFFYQEDDDTEAYIDGAIEYFEGIYDDS